MDRLRCAEENLNTKRDELEEKNNLYEEAQERVIELSGELNALRSESDTASKFRLRSLLEGFEPTFKAPFSSYRPI